MQDHNLKYKIKLKDRTYKYSINIIKFLDTLPFRYFAKGYLYPNYF